MSNIERMPNASGEIELFGASQHLMDELDANFTARGEKAAVLLVATLTETPYVYTDGDQKFAIEVSNRYKGVGDDVADTSDTVDEARLALQEFTGAKVPGTRKVHIGTYATRYASMWRDLRPGFTTPDHSTKSFDEAFVEASRSKGVEIQSPEQGKRIILAAPRRISGLRLGDRTRFADPYDTERHSLVTKDGYMVSVYSTESLFGIKHYDMSDDVTVRGGRAPSSRIAKEIEDRVVKLRTKHTVR